MKYSAVIFDLGGVLINLDYQKTIRSFQELGVSNFEEMYSQASQTNLFNDFETGKISAQRFVNALLDFVPAGTSPNKIVQAWNSMILDVPEDRLTLLQQLQKKLPVFLLSNTNSLEENGQKQQHYQWKLVSIKYTFHTKYISGNHIRKYLILFALSSNLKRVRHFLLTTLCNI